MSGSKILLAPGTLLAALEERSRHALAVGALHPIESECEFFRQAGIPFFVRVAANLRRKEEEKAERETAQAPQAPDFTPFLPPEEELLVALVSETHMGVLNKFNVIPHHLLILTRRFESQEFLLNQEDFEALAACLNDVDGLGFYNGGTVAGASQAHKHLQIIPLPMTAKGCPVPLEAIFQPADLLGDIQCLDPLPFRHAFSGLPYPLPGDPSEAGHLLRERYLSLLKAAGVEIQQASGEEPKPAPYNLLLTRRWMLVVPRSRECFGPISINALGYAGSLFVKNAKERRLLREAGPLSVLAHAAFSI